VNVEEGIAPPQRAQPSSAGLRLRLRALVGQKRHRGAAHDTLITCDSCLVRSTDLKGSEAGKRASVVMASSGASAQSAGARGKRQAGRRGDGRRRRCRIGRRGRPGRRSRRKNARMTTQESMRGLQGRQHLRAQTTGLSARTAGAPPSASTADRGARASRVGLFCFCSRSLSFYTGSLYFSSDTRLLLPATPVIVGLFCFHSRSLLFPFNF